jgi:phenylacetate-CoA oxygenase PaaI subunit
MNVGDLDAPARAALRREILRLADSKRVLGLRYSDWLLGAPSIEAGISASAMAQDEWGHARLLYAMLKDFDEDPVAVEHDRAPAAYASVSLLDEPFADWATWVVSVVVVDGALEVLLGGLAAGRYDTARGRVPKMIAEEGFHADLGNAWFTRLASGTEEARARIHAEVERMLPVAARFVAPGDGAAEPLERFGLRTPESDLAVQLEERMLRVLAPALGPDEVRSLMAAGAGIDWDPGRGRSPGAPRAEVVERARGDLNRELFVE